MISSKNFLKVLFKFKSKAVYYIFILQIVVALILTIISNSTRHPLVLFTGTTTIKITPIISYCVSLLGMLIITSLLAEFVLVVITAITNERLNRSKTWRLSPIADSKYFLCNIFSSVMEVIYLAFLELFSIGLITLITISVLQVNKKWHLLVAEIKKIPIDYQILIEIGILIILCIITCYLLFSFLSFSSSAIINFLPNISSRIILFLVRVITVIALMVILNYSLGFLNDLFNNLINQAAISSSNYSLNLAYNILGITCLDIIITILDILIFTKFYEAKTNH